DSSVAWASTKKSSKEIYERIKRKPPMSLSDKDLELASKYRFAESDFKDWLSGKKENVQVMMFTHEALEAFLAERDALAIKEQALIADAYRVAAGKAFYECERTRMTCLADVVYEAVISLT